MSPLKFKQMKFPKLLQKLYMRCIYLDYEIILGASYRDPQANALYAKEGKGIKDSLHELRLAQDIIRVDKAGEPIYDPAAYFALGMFWKGLSENAIAPYQGLAGTPEIHCTWGGDFKSPAPLDPYHFSIQHDNVE